MPRPPLHALALALAFALTLATSTASADCANPNTATLGSTGAGIGQFNNPQRCATDLAGNLYVVDTGNSRVQKWTKSSGIWAAFGSAGTGAGQFTNPRAVAVDSLGNIYVTDTNNNRIEKFNASFTYVTAWGSAGSGNGQFNGAQGICVDPTNTYVYVAEYGNNRIQKFTTAGAYVTQWASASATDVACDPAGNVYVSSYGASHVTKYSGTGTVLATIGSAGSGNGQVVGAQGVTVDRYGNLYVADGGNLRIEKYTTAGTWLANVGTSAFSNVFGVAVDTSGVLWAPDGTQNHVLKFAAVAINVTESGPVLITYGRPTAWIASVTPSAVSGTVTLLDGGTPIRSSAISGGAATDSLGLPGAGSHSLTMQVSNGGTCAGVTSAPATLTVLKATARVLSLPSLASAGVGQAVTWNLSLANDNYLGYGTPTGTVQLFVDGVAYGAPATVANGGASVTVTISVPGAHAITYSYSGDANFLPATGGFGTYTVVSPTAMPSTLATWTSSVLAPPTPIGVEGVAFDAGDNVYVSDYYNQRILVFSRTGNLLRTWGSGGSGNGQFMQPWGIGVDAAGNVFVTDVGNNRVQKFTSAGVYLAQWGTLGNGYGQFNGPVGLALDALGNVYVADVNSRIQEFTGTGTFIRSWNDGMEVGFSPYELAIRPNGNVLLTDWYLDRVEEFSNSGYAIVQLGSSGSANGQFFSPAGVALDAAGNSWVADRENDRVQKFGPTGAWLGSVQFGPSAILGGVGVDNSGFLYVGDPGDGTIVKLGLLPAITSVTDVANDQGRAVRLRFTGTSSDFAAAAFPTTGYQVYRRIDAAPSSAAHPAPPARAGRAAPDGARMDGWDYVLTVPATGDTAYNVVVPTLADSNQAGLNPSTFLVRAATGTPGTYYDSAPGSGWSVDNLPPAPPAPFTAARVSGSTYLHWGASGEGDFWYYRLYRGASAGFTPGPGNLVATRSDTGYVDAGAAPSYYKLTAVDVNGNESPAALVTPGGTTAVGDAGPVAFSLERVSPNPATSRALAVSFGLPTDAPARVELLDVAGRVVAARDVSGAGRHTLALGASQRLAPGIYLVRLSQAGQRRVQRVAVVD